MRILLINPPSVNRDLSELAPPLGLYALATVAKEAGSDVRVWDGNLQAAHRGDVRFYTDVANVIDKYNPTLLGVTSMVVNSHVALNVMRAAKEQRPQLITVAGGPHFSAFAHEAVKAFPWIDHVIQGEGEAAFGSLLKHTRARGQDGNLPHVFAEPVTEELLNRTPTFFDNVPWRDYFKRNPRRTADYESSRGCIFQCSFCYSPAHWGPVPRYLSDDRVVKDLRTLEWHGVKHVFFVDDNFLNDLSRADRLCERLARERMSLRWLCYATLNRLGGKIIDRLESAGCNGVFVGIDAVVAATQRQFGKRFFKGRDDARGRLRSCIDSGITPTCALIVRPEADDEELDEVVGFAAELRELGCAVRLNPLIGYQGTPFAATAESAWYTEARVRLMLDDSSLLRENSFAQADPRLFPYHCSTRAPEMDELRLRDIHAAGTVVRHFPKTLVAMRTRNERLWCRIQQIAASARACRRVNLRESERKMAMQTFQQGLLPSDAAVAAGEFATSALPKSRDWIPVVLRSNAHDRVADVRPFAMDQTGAAPDLLVVAFDETVRTFELDAAIDRKDLQTIAASFKKRSSESGRGLRIHRQTLAALRSADILRFRDHKTTF